ncbi:MAG: hypothetical protein AB1454_07295 [Candidatus Auribacterota bacterium]
MITIYIHEIIGLKRQNEPVSIGVSFPKGLEKAVDVFTLFDESNQVIPHQADVMARWADGSVKWVLLDFCASVDKGDTKKVILKRTPDDQPRTKSAAIHIEESGDGYMITCGKVRYVLDKKVLRPFTHVFYDTVSVLEDDGCSVSMLDESGICYKPIISRTEIETCGPVRATLLFYGTMRAAQNKTGPDFKARISFYARSEQVKVQFCLINSRPAVHPGNMWDLGDTGSFFFKDLSLGLFLKPDSQPVIRYTVDPVKDTEPLSASKLVLYQESSGGENWNSPNHKNRFGKVPLKFQGYRLETDKGVQEGLRAQPVVSILNTTFQASAGLEGFWQNFPSSIEAERTTLTVRLFPHQFSDSYELQGGEQKTHTVYLSFRKPNRTELPSLPVHGPLVPVVDPEWVCKSGVFPFAVPYSKIHDERYTSVIESAVRGKSTFFDRRERVDEYGWRNFGELYGDHEAVYHTGKQPFISHYNNQYDNIYAMLQHLGMSGMPQWYRLAYDLAYHCMDIDIYHTDGDRPEYNHGLFWHTDHYTDAATCTHRTYSVQNKVAKNLSSYGGGPSPSHLYTSGLIAFYYMTGDTFVKEACEELIEWGFALAKGRKRLAARLKSSVKKAVLALRTLLSRRAFQPYELDGPGRASGNVLNAMLDGYTFSGDKKYLRMAEKLIRRCISPNDRIERRDLFNSEMRWMYLVFLHSLAKYIIMKENERRQDRMYSYAVRSIVHYARFMALNEYPFLRKPEILEYPNETWAAQDMRKSVILNFASRFIQSDIDSKIYRDRGEFFYNSSLDDLHSFKTRTLTRPVILLMNYGHIFWYFRER